MHPKNSVAPLDPKVAKDGLKLKVQVYIFCCVLMCIRNFLKDISDGQIDTGLAVFMNTIIINVCTTLALSIIQRFVSLKAIDNQLLLVFKTLTPMIWISKSSKLRTVLWSLCRRN